MALRRLLWIEGAAGGSGAWAGTVVRPLEAAGVAHAAYAARRYAKASAAGSAPEAEEEASDAPPSGSHAKKKAPAPRFVEGKDPYEVLGLGELRYSATDDDIKAMYKKLVLVHHPDKQGGSEEAFKAIQAAYELLSDPRRRRVFDSSDEVDESIPSPSDPGDFFALYRPVFERLARFSVRKPVPSLGSGETGEEEVEAFYAFWFVFESWREFSHADEYDPEQAESRDERRWMERQNEKGRQRRKREDTERTARLVEQAHRLDPRIRAREAREKAARNAERDARRAAAKAKEREEEEAKRAAQAAVEEKRKAEEAAREQARRKLKSARDRLTALAEPLLAPGAFTSDDLHLLLSYTPLARLAPLLKALEARTGALDALRAELAVVEGERAEAVAKEEGSKASRGKESEGGAGKEWTAEETGALVKALAKYPGGQTRRWELVAAFVGTGRSVKEVIAKTNALKVAAAAKPAPPPEVKKASLQVAGASASIASAPSTNWDAVNTGAAPPSPGPARTATPPVPAAAPTAPATANTAAATTAGAAPAAAAAEEWSVEQQRALEAALRQCPASLGATRWDEIAKLVPGKSKKQCVERFKLIAERLKAAKK